MRKAPLWAWNSWISNEAVSDIAGVIAITASLLVYGVLQERIVTVGFGPDSEIFEHSVFLVLCNRFCTCSLAMAYILVTQSSVFPAAPVKSYGWVSFSNVISTSCQYEALRYVSFAVQTLAKSAKALPVMLWGTLYGGKQYKAADYMHASAITIGCTMFVLTGDVSSRVAEASHVNYAIGAALMLVYLAVDGLTSTWQDTLFNSYNMGICDQVRPPRLCIVFVPSGRPCSCWCFRIVRCSYWLAVCAAHSISSSRLSDASGAHPASADIDSPFAPAPNHTAQCIHCFGPAGRSMQDTYFGTCSQLKQLHEHPAHVVADSAFRPQPTHSDTLSRRTRGWKHNPRQSILRRVSPITTNNLSAVAGPLHHCLFHRPQLCCSTGDSAATALHPFLDPEPRCTRLDRSAVTFLCSSPAAHLIHHQTLRGTGVCHHHDNPPVLLDPALQPGLLDLPISGPVVSGYVVEEVEHGQSAVLLWTLFLVWPFCAQSFAPDVCTRVWFLCCEM